MSPAEALDLVAYLVAAFRPRDWTDTSSAVYVERLRGADAERAQAAARWLVDHVRYMPSVAEVLEAVRAQPVPPRAELPARAAATPEEVVAILEEGRQRIRAQGPGQRPLRVVRGVEAIAVDDAEVERRRAAVRAAKAQLIANGGGA